MCSTVSTHWSVRSLAEFRVLSVRRSTAVIAALCVGFVGCARFKAPNSTTTSATIQADDSETAFETPDAGIVLEAPTISQPVVAGISIVPKQVQPGSFATLTVHVKTAPGWHIYPQDRPTGVAQPISLQLELPDDLAEQGEWQYPPAVRSPHGDEFIYEGELSFRRRLQLSATAMSGTVQVRCQFRYQACDPFSCRPPAMLTLAATADVTNPTVKGGP